MSVVVSSLLASSATRIAPAMKPGEARGSVTRVKVRTGRVPNEAATSS